MKVDPRFLKEEGYEIYTGNELIVKGLLETEGGTHLWTGYPGSPVAGFFDCIESIQEIPKTMGIHACIANNEALSVAALNGSQMHGLRAISVMKSVGVHVAADALALGNLAGAHRDGGAVVVMGDDPWNDSTQVPSDSRYLCKHLHMPVMEPSTPQEIKDWIDLSFKLSRQSELYIGYIVTTNQADGGGTVFTRRNHSSRVNTNNPFQLDTAKVDFEKMVLLPPRTSRREEAFKERYARLWDSATALNVNRLENADKEAPFAFVSSGLAYGYLRHALKQLGVEGEFPILKLGISYPIDPRDIEKLASLASNIIVVEERRGFIEEQVAQIVARMDNPIKVYGKVFPGGKPGFPETRGMNSSVIIEILSPWIEDLGKAGMIQVSLKTRPYEVIKDTEAFDVNLVSRTPTFCPGCPHRDSASVLVEIKKQFRESSYMRKRHRRQPVDLVFHGDTGCYTMLMFEPTKDLMHNYSGMGLGGGTGMGIDPFITNKQVVFMGDSTFFHSGQIAISNSIKNRQDIAYIILDNKTTAMTGHQPTPGMEMDIMGNTTFAQSIDKIVEAMISEGKVEVVRVNPAMRDHYRTILEDTILKDGVKVIIADKECGITHHRRINRQDRETVRDKGFLPEKRFINITPEVCEYCLECTVATGCPGLTFTETNFGRKIQTDLSWCVADTACAKIYACPSFEEVAVIRTQSPEKRYSAADFDSLPLPAIRDFDDQWHIYLAGVGGMGIATSDMVLVRAAHRQGYHVLFCDKNGLAIRNGGVYSHLTFTKKSWDGYSPIIPYGSADLILGLDPLEAARGLDPKGNLRIGHPSKTVALINSFKTPTIHALLGREDFCVEDVEEIIRKHTIADEFFSANLSSLSERYFGTKLYVNIMMLGVAFQSGHLPLTLESVEWGIKETTGKAAVENWSAFNIGRKVYLDFARKPKKVEARTYHDVISEKSELLRKLGKSGEKKSQTLWRLTVQAVERIRLDEESLYHLAHRIYELMEYQNASLAQEYIDMVSRVFQNDSAAKGYEVTRAVLWNLHRVMAIKDEVSVARLLTSPEKQVRDMERYNVNPELGDKIVYRHLNRPEFEFLGIKVRFHIQSRDWMLRIVARAKFLRNILPGWHKKERTFRDWYIGILPEFTQDRHHDYQRFVDIFRSPEQVTGYREVRYPKMEAARQRSEEALRQIVGEKSVARISSK